LEKLLEHFKDPNFRFDEPTHTYTYIDSLTQKPVQIFESVTGFISQFKEEFDSNLWAGRVAKKRGVTKQQILNEWQRTSDTALTLGTNVHKWIEDYYNGLEPEIPVEPEVKFRVDKFLDIHQRKLHKFEPVAQELRLFSRKWGLAGTTDALFKLNGKYYVGDWKTNKKFTTDLDTKGRFKKLLYPFDHLWENSLNSYSIQLSMYRLMLEEVGFQTAGAFLCWIGPNKEKPMLYNIVDLREPLRKYLEKNKTSL